MLQFRCKLQQVATKLQHRICNFSESCNKLQQNCNALCSNSVGRCSALQQSCKTNALFFLLCECGAESTHPVTIPPYKCSYTRMIRRHYRCVCRCLSRPVASASPPTTHRYYPHVSPIQGQTFRTPCLHFKVVCLIISIIYKRSILVFLSSQVVQKRDFRLYGKNREKLVVGCQKKDFCPEGKAI